jgi:hypothetical protein
MGAGLPDAGVENGATAEIQQGQGEERGSRLQTVSTRRHVTENRDRNATINA